MQSHGRGQSYITTEMLEANGTEKEIVVDGLNGIGKFCDNEIEFGASEDATLVNRSTAEVFAPMRS